METTTAETTTTTTTLEVSPCIWDLATHAGREHGRYSRPGVGIWRTNGITYASATDGRRAAVLEREDPGDDVAPFVIPREALQGNKPKAAEDKIQIVFEGNQGAIHTRGAIVPFQSADDSFPPVQDVIDNAERHIDANETDSAIGVDPKFIAEAGTLADRYIKRHAEGEVCARWSHGRANHPLVIYIRGHDDSRLRIAIMPCKLP